MKTTPQKQNLTPGYACIQGFFWMVFAAVMGFSSIYLLSAGFTNTEIGLIIAAAGTVSAVLQPVTASYADRPQSPSLKKILIVLGAALLVCAVLLLVLRQRVVTGLFYGGCITITQLIVPLMNALGMETLNQGYSLNFGVSRGMGSVAYAIAAYILGIIAAKAGAFSVPLSILLIGGCCVSALVLFPFSKTVRETKSGKRKESANPAAFFLRYKRFSVVLLGCILVYISHVLLNNFTFQIVQAKGGGSSEMGFSMALSAMLELPAMFGFVYMVKKVRCDIWFRITGIFFTLKALGTLLAPSIMTFYGVQVFQMFGWALISVSSVYYVNAIMEEQDVIKGQAYMTMTYTLGSVLGALIGGWLIDLAGVNAMLLFAVVSAAAGMVIQLLASERTV